MIDHASAFHSDVLEQFADAYLSGRTPIPCVSCNEGPKFTDLLAYARELGADALATGHYVRRVVGPGGVELHRGSDPARDQSYFLFATTRPQLDYLRFPLGDLPKSRVREIAAELGLRVAAKPDSQDICFVPDGDYAAVVDRVRPGRIVPGPIVTRSGERIGTHRGIVHYTVGQRRGLEIGGLSEPLYVIAIDAAANAVIVGPREALAVRSARLVRFNALAAADELAGPLEVKVRSLARPAPARWDGTHVHFAAPEYGVAPGQAAVLYRGDRVLGGGWIDGTEPWAGAAQSVSSRQPVPAT